ncbi:MAG: adenosylcobinamide amidohydrolase [Acidimicrobiia bacterium]|nr:adenosylcobinamide amidohydrolase [Acidimicrobiia bacterium]MYB72615.1 adenosylcobinamide amidohydrolase [Acidimicrobiia bacterium]MYH99435.1 adenosylcobinamide amidohydrolase [Acidimicrobiia bacterium]
MVAVSSAAVGGGIREIGWLVNIGVTSDYSRTDLDDHAAEVAAQLELVGPGVALFTAAAIDQVSRAEHGGAVVDATVGISHPTWAADLAAVGQEWAPGTINSVVQLPVGLEPGAAVNAVATATEAKVQALVERGIPGTGTASDAVAIVWPAHVEVERFAGPRSTVGASIARAVHEAVWKGAGGPS